MKKCGCSNPSQLWSSVYSLISDIKCEGENRKYLKCHTLYLCHFLLMFRFLVQSSEINPMSLLKIHHSPYEFILKCWRLKKKKASLYASSHFITTRCWWWWLSRTGTASFLSSSCQWGQLSQYKAWTVCHYLPKLSSVNKFVCSHREPGCFLMSLLSSLKCEVRFCAWHLSRECGVSVLACFYHFIFSSAVICF